MCSVDVTEQVLKSMCGGVLKQKHFSYESGLMWTCGLIRYIENIWMFENMKQEETYDLKIEEY